jgi:oxygen-independent coproporphyrinogen-3 oxidase
LDQEAWKTNLQRAFEFPIQHISSYALPVDPKTALDHFIRTGKCEAPDEEQARIHFEILMEESAKQDFIHYEVSNFAKTGYFSRHNTSYWQGKPYLGIGPSAHSYAGSTRSWNVANNAKYLKGIEQGVPDREFEILSETERMNEMIMTGLRTRWGLSLESFEGQFGLRHLKKLKERSDRFLGQGLLEVESGRLRATKAGFFLIDGIASDLFLD